MIKKSAAEQVINIKKQEISKIIEQSMLELSKKMDIERASLTNKFSQEINNIISNLSAKIDDELDDLMMKSVQRTQVADDKVHAFQLDNMPGVKTGGKKKKHNTPRDTKDNKGLPPFWRKNFDYGESPYMNIGFIDKITDKPPFKKKRKKNGK